MGMIIQLNDKATMSNDLISMHIRKPMTLQHMRFFTIYLAKINPNQPNRKTVRFSVNDFAGIMGVEVNEQDIKKNVTSLMEHVVFVPSENHKNGVVACHLFKTCEIWSDENSGEMMMEFECSDEVEPYMFKLKKNFTTYEVWNTLRLHSVTDSRMYQLLKQFQTIGERIILISDLKEQLGIDKKAYPEYKIFSRDVLKKCQKALEQSTDICFDYKSIGRPAKSIKFTIYKNDNYDKQVTLEEIGGVEFQAAADINLDDEQCPGQMSIEDYLPTETEENKEIAFFREPFESVNPAWKVEDGQIEYIVSMIRESIPYGMYHNSYEIDLAVYDKLERILRKAKAEGARSIYGWLEYMFTNTEILEKY